MRELKNLNYGEIEVINSRYIIGDKVKTKLELKYPQYINYIEDKFDPQGGYFGGIDHVNILLKKVK